MYQELDETGVELPRDGEVLFGQELKLPSYYRFTADTAVFSAQRQNVEGRRLYILSRVAHPPAPN